MDLEIRVYLIIAYSLFVYRTVLSGRKNGCFYFKGSNPAPKLLERPLSNLHFIETPAWYSQTGGVFLLTLALARMSNPVWELIPILISLGIASLITLGTVQAASLHFQRGITGGTKANHELDNISQNEVAIVVFGIKIQFWKGRLFNNRGRIVAQWMGIAEIIAGIILLTLQF